MLESRDKFLSILIASASVLLNIFFIVLVYPSLLSTEGIDLTLYRNEFLSFIDLSLRLDALSAFFVMLISVVSILATIYSVKYADEYQSKYSLSSLALFTTVFSLSMIGVVCSDHVFSFLVFWELMSLSSYLMVIYDYKDKDNVNAGFIYFVMTHMATAFLLVAFLLLSHLSSDLSFGALTVNAHNLDPQLSLIAFIMFLVGLGIKMGVVPFHFWLPIAHPAAPSHVSALMSAIMVKVPICILMRVVFDFLVPEAYMGYSILGLGIVSGLLGVIYAIKENDIKKLLAYSTIENVGIVLIGLGLSIVFLKSNNVLLASLAFMAAVFHIMNHAIYKSSLFLGAGSIVSKCHTRDLNKLGGLIHLMPKTALFFLVSSLSIAAMPFFNGFVSEWLLYQSLIRAMQLGETSLHFVLPIVLMFVAMIAGFAFVAFTKLFAIAFLGYARSENAKQAQEVSPMMWLPMALLSFLCLFFGLYPQIMGDIWANILNRFSLPYPAGTPYFVFPHEFFNADPLSHLMFNYFPSRLILIFTLMILIIIVFISYFLKVKSKRDIPWTCGFELDATMQYTASSYSQPLLRLMKNFYKIDFAHIFLDIYFGFYNFCKELRDKVHSGNLHGYLLYVLLALVGGLIYARYSS